MARQKQVHVSKPTLSGKCLILCANSLFWQMNNFVCQCHATKIATHLADVGFNTLHCIGGVRNPTGNELRLQLREQPHCLLFHFRSQPAVMVACQAKWWSLATHCHKRFISLPTRAVLKQQTKKSRTGIFYEKSTKNGHILARRGQLQKKNSASLEDFAPVWCPERLKYGEIAEIAVL